MSAAVRPKTQIRAMLPSDLRAVSAIERASYQFPWSSGIFRDCLLAGYHCLVADLGGTIVGYGIMSIAAGEAHLLNLCVHPSVHRQGFGRRLLSALLLQADHRGADKVYLEVRPSNRAAIELYLSVGFEHIGMRPSYYQSKEGREDAAIFVATSRPAS
jgi:ribosomal-protein-alanine N-acetyltransferase